MNFEELGLSPEIVRAVTERGYTTATPIQEQAIPHILMARDVIGLAQTGTGKTAGFTLPMIEILAGGRARARMPRSLILSPTRELAAQIADNFDIYGKYHKLTKALLVGGESMGDQIKLLERGVDVLIATPGRLLDLFERGNILLNDIKVLVIDEADRMLDMGFIPDIEKIVSKVPPIRQTLLFSATMQPEIKKLADKFLTNPRQVSVAPPASPAATVQQSLIWTSSRRKREVLDALIKREDVKNAFIFLNRKRDVDELAKWLKGKGYSAAPMHGDMVQSVRTVTLQGFKDGKITLLVCSDVAARGLDIQGVSHVFNYDLPFNADDYVHRIGRTGRAGMAGRALSIAARDDDEKLVENIERLIKRAIPLEEIEVNEERAPRAASSRSAQPRPAREERSRSEGSGRARPVREVVPEEVDELADLGLAHGATNQRRAEKFSHRQQKPAVRNNRPPRQDDEDGPNSFSQDDLPAFLRR